MEINFKKEWFESGYYVYVIEIKYNKKFFYYVGQTGDRKHKAARSPFYRLMAHYNPYNRKGTDSQLVNGLLRENIIVKTKKGSVRCKVEDEILNGNLIIKTKFIKIFDFDTSDTKERHKEKRIFVENIEQALINNFLESKKRLINDENKIGSKTDLDEKAMKRANQIFKKYSYSGRKN